MTLEAQTREEARRKATWTYRKARVLSFAIFLAAVATLLAIAYYLSPLLAVGVLMAAAFLSMTPLGNAYTAATVWAGKWVSSCPNCPDVGMEECSIEIHECEVCGQIEAEVTGVFGGGWISRHKKDEPIKEYCSWDCRNADSNGGDSA